MTKEVLIVLGSTNSPSGKLSDIALSRLNHCINNYKKGYSIICTGGWGKHFNTAKQAHSELAKTYLIKHNVLEKDILDLVLSANTVEDALKLKPVLDKLTYHKLTIITSDYHLKRVELIFNQILKDYNLNFVGVKHSFDKETYHKLATHETKAINSILENGLYY